MVRGDKILREVCPCSIIYLTCGEGSYGLVKKHVYAHVSSDSQGLASKFVSAISNMNPPSVHLQSFSNVLHSTPLLMKFIWSLQGVDCNWTLDLDEIEEVNR
jgi:hypothetical protein